MRVVSLVLVLFGLCAVDSVRAQIFTEGFSSYYLSEGVGGGTGNGIETDCDFPLPNCGIQADTALDVFGWGWVEGWEPGGIHAVHAVDLNTFGAGDPNIAVTFFAGNQGGPGSDTNNLMVSDPIAANAAGTSYKLNFDSGPAVFAAASEATTDENGILVEILREDNSVLADLLYFPGAWPGGPDAQELSPADELTYVGDGSGDIRLRFISNPGNTNQFGGAVDNVRILVGAQEVFFEDFNDFQGSDACDNFQFDTGLFLSCNKTHEGWTGSGLGTFHIVDLDDAGDTAVMLFNGRPRPPGGSNTNTLTLVEGIDANDAGAKYNLTARIGPSVWAAAGQATTEDDYITIEILREDDTVLRSFEAHPEPWEAGNPDAQDLDGDGRLDTVVQFQYTGDGSGPVRLRLLGEVQGASRFGGAIDDIVIDLAVPPCDFNGDDACDYNDLNSTDGLYSAGDLTVGIPVAQTDAKFDLTGDGLVDGDDLAQWLSSAGFVKGDTDTDGSVNFSDYNRLQNGYRSSREWNDGNFDGDSATGLNDFNDLANAFLNQPGSANVELQIDSAGGIWISGSGDLNGYSIRSNNGSLTADADDDATPFVGYLKNDSDEVAAAALGERVTIDGSLKLDASYTGELTNEALMAALTIEYGTGDGTFLGTVGLMTGLQGDFNGNGVLDADDINMLVGESASGADNLAFDLNGDNKVDGTDVRIWAKDLKKTWVGDANVNGEFNSSDMVQVFAAGKYEKPEAAVWTQGDWNGDGFFMSSDMVAAFVDGGYEKGQRPGAAAVPEPSGLFLLGLIIFTMTMRRRNY